MSLLYPAKSRFPNRFSFTFLLTLPMRKHFSVFVIYPLFIACFILNSCQNLVKNEAYYLAISKYVYAYTSGAIGRDDAIRVRFTDPAVGAEQVGQKVEANIFSVTPSIPGRAVQFLCQPCLLCHLSQ